MLNDFECLTPLYSRPRLNCHQNHAQKQDINCPGCDQHFLKFSSFVQHIEFSQCPKISQQTVVARCQANINFTRGLMARDENSGIRSNAHNDFTPYLGVTRPSCPPSNWVKPLSHPCQDSNSEGWDSAGYDASKKTDFPRMGHAEYPKGSTSVPDLLIGDDTDHLKGKQGIKPWASKKNLFPNTPAAQRPTSQQLEQLHIDQSAAAVHAQNAYNNDIDDPDGPNFNAERYYQAYLRKYKCPKCKKSKTFDSPANLLQHLNSPAHAFEKSVSCPCCYNKFKSLFALAAHCESESKRCGFRYGDMYEIFLQQLTWDLIQVKGEHKEDGTLKYDITDKAKEDYGIVELSEPQPTSGHQQVYGFQPAAARLMESVVGQLHQQNKKIGGSLVTKTTATSSSLTAEALAQLDARQRKKADGLSGLVRENESVAWSYSYKNNDSGEGDDDATEEW